jgi:hypothetical protein
MKPSRLITLLIGLICGVAYAFLTMWIVSLQHRNVSVAFIFILPIILGAIPVLFSTKEQLKSFWKYLLLPWGIVLTFFYISLIREFEGMICLVIIVGPFLILGSLGAFIFRLIKLKNEENKTPLYSCLLLPFIFLFIEANIETKDQFETVSTSMEVNADPKVIWENIKNVKNILPSEFETHFIHQIGIPKPLNGELDKEGVGAIRSITWEKGIEFREIIKSWNEGNSFTYDIEVNPNSIPPTTLDEHVMIGGRYFNVLEGGYNIKSLSSTKSLVTLTCTYRITTNLNFYSKWWADFILSDFNEMILEVVKKRSEKIQTSYNPGLESLQVCSRGNINAFNTA